MWRRQASLSRNRLLSELARDIASGTADVAGLLRQRRSGGTEVERDRPRPLDGASAWGRAA
jgi:hypothetical protein